VVRLWLAWAMGGLVARVRPGGRLASLRRAAVEQIPQGPHSAAQPRSGDGGTQAEMKRAPAQAGGQAGCRGLFSAGGHPQRCLSRVGSEGCRGFNGRKARVVEPLFCSRLSLTKVPRAQSKPRPNPRRLKPGSRRSAPDCVPREGHRANSTPSVSLFAILATRPAIPANGKAARNDPSGPRKVGMEKLEAKYIHFNGHGQTPWRSCPS